jgi:DNA polymerase type B, organellar and viral
MKSFNMPVGSPIYFEGDVSLIGPGTGYNLINKLFGFFEVEIESPQNMKIPLLQTRLETKNGDRTVAPLGTWRGTYFSEELFNAMNYGYKFKILRGYLFEEANIFSEYVDYLYNLKVNSPSKSPDYIISKLLLNTLYGRFGMNPHMETHLIVANEETLKLNEKKVITNVVDLKNGNELVSFFDTLDWNKESKKKSLNISVPISAAVTACARIHMSKFKTMDNFTLYYSDTDSIDINKPLDNKYIGSDLGKMKLEHIFDEAIFITPKVYGGITSSYEYVKVKGLKNPVSFSQLKPLLIKDANLEIKQDKWYRNISEGNIKIIPKL